MAVHFKVHVDGALPRMIQSTIPLPQVPTTTITVKLMVHTRLATLMGSTSAPLPAPAVAAAEAPSLNSCSLKPAAASAAAVASAVTPNSKLSLPMLLREDRVPLMRSIGALGEWSAVYLLTADVIRLTHLCTSIMTLTAL